MTRPTLQVALVAIAAACAARDAAAQIGLPAEQVLRIDQAVEAARV